MKIIILLIVQRIAAVAANITFIWGIVEIALYLVKDKEFNWWSVWSFIISAVVTLACFCLCNKCKNKKR